MCWRNSKELNFDVTHVSTCVHPRSIRHRLVKREGKKHLGWEGMGGAVKSSGVGTARKKGKSTFISIFKGLFSFSFSDSYPSLILVLL